VSKYSHKDTLEPKAALTTATETATEVTHMRIKEKCSYRWHCSFLEAKDKIAVIGACRRDVNCEIRLDVCFQNSVSNEELEGQGLSKEQIKTFKRLVEKGAIFLSDTDTSISFTTAITPRKTEQLNLPTRTQTLKSH